MAVETEPGAAARAGRGQRIAAATLLAASTVVIATNLGGVFVAAISFGARGNAFTVGLTESASTSAADSSTLTAYFTEMIVSSTEIGFAAQAWISLSRILWGVVWITIAACVAVFSAGAFRAAVFGRRLPALLSVTAVAVAVGGCGAELAWSFGVASAMFDLRQQGQLAELTINESADLVWPLVTGVVLALLAVVFRSGERLQRDTEGLV